jgi:hypothetical protein
MMSASTTVLRFGLFGAGAYFIAAAVFAVLIWLAGGGEAWEYFALLTLPAELLFVLPAPEALQHWLVYASPAIIVALGALGWFVVGCFVGGVRALYRRHS